MTEPKRPLKVFLCHAHADRDPVRGLYARLTNDGVDAWLDKEKLLPGQDWELEIKKAVREADVVVVCLSKQFNQAGFRQKEVRLALDTAMEKPEGEIFIIPARLEECDNLESLRKWHWVDLFENNGYEMLMRALRVRANSIDATLQVKKRDVSKATSSDSKSNKVPESSSIGNKQTISSSQDFSSIRINSNSVIQPDISRDEVKEPPKKLPSKKRVVPTADGKAQNDKLESKPKKRFKLKTEYVVAVIGAVATIIAGLLSSPLIEKWFSPAPVATETLTATFTLTSPPVTSLQTLEPTVTSLPTEITDAKGVSMVLVPEGEFTMGSTEEQGLAECKKFRNGSGNDCQEGWFTNEEPPHSVYLNSYWIDQTEVTNEMYAKCVEGGICQPPIHSDPQFYPQDYYEVYYKNPIYANYPVVNVSWNDAQKFCSWRDGRLPTEAEWEKAARGTDDRVYPWGDVIDCSYANHQTNDGVCVGGDNTYIYITAVGSYPSGASPYGALDMAGNVAEWVADWYSGDYYGQSPTTNPLGPPSGDFHVIRGGSWTQDAPFLRTTVRTVYSSYDDPNDSMGFRCAKDVTP